MELEIDPVPAEPEQEAIEVALGRLAPELSAAPEPGAWWRRGVAENVSSEED